jgi:hypothetical protein
LLLEIKIPAVVINSGKYSTMCQKTYLKESMSWKSFWCQKKMVQREKDVDVQRYM